MESGLVKIGSTLALSTGVIIVSPLIITGLGLSTFSLITGALAAITLNISSNIVEKISNALTKLLIIKIKIISI